ncbi:hypothetical protein [Paraburkholderia humisilvae]|uniref:helix-turn-helix domain-containing transcriptional regulator n=1 Tax=Paraburkholderia humisilvae TaxID=627669 RepID=UPI0031B58712
MAGQAGVGQESLSKTLTPGSKQRLDTIFKLLHALGIKLSATPQAAHARSPRPFTKAALRKPGGFCFMAGISGIQRL